MSKRDIKSISPSYFTRRSNEELIINEKELGTYKLANISLAAFLGIIDRFADYQNKELDINDPVYKDKLIRSIFSLNDNDNKNLDPQYFKMLATLSESENIPERTIINAGEKQNGNLAQFFSEQLTANCIDAVCNDSCVGKFGLGLKSVFGMLSRLAFGSQAVIHSHKDNDDYTFSLIQTGKTNVKTKSQLITSLNNTQIQYYLSQVAKKNKVPNVWRTDSSNKNGTKITLLSSDENGFSSEYLSEFYKGILYHRFNPNVRIRINYNGVEEVINEDCVTGDHYPEISINIGSNYIQFEDFGSGGNPVQFLMGSSKSEKNTLNSSVKSKIEIHPKETDNIVFTCANVVLSSYVDIQNISTDSLVKGLQIQFTENAVNFSQSRRGWSATEKNTYRGFESTTTQIVESFERYIKTVDDDYLKIKVLNTILAWYDSLNGSNQINKTILSDLPTKLRSIIEPVISNLKQKNKLFIPNTKEFEVLNFPQNVIRVSEHILQKYTPEGFGQKIPNLSNSGIELWTVKMKSRLDRERLHTLAEELKTKEVSPQKILAAISIKIEKPAQIWIDEAVYQKYLDLKKSWKKETDPTRQKEIEEEFWIYKSMLEVAINQEDSYIISNQEKVKFAGLEDGEVENTSTTESQEKHELSFTEKRLHNTCMYLWSMQQSIFNPKLRNRENFSPLEIEIRFDRENEPNSNINIDIVYIDLGDDSCVFNTKKHKILLYSYKNNKLKRFSTKDLPSLEDKIYNHLSELKKYGKLKLYPEFIASLEKLINDDNDLSDEQNLENFYQTLSNIEAKDHIRPEFQGPWRVVVNHDYGDTEIEMINALGVKFTLIIKTDIEELHLSNSSFTPYIKLKEANVRNHMDLSYLVKHFDFDDENYFQSIFDNKFATLTNNKADFIYILRAFLHSKASPEINIKYPIKYTLNFSRYFENNIEYRSIFITDLDSKTRYKFEFKLKNDEIYLSVEDIRSREKMILDNFHLKSNAREEILELFRRIDLATISNTLPDSRYLNNFDITEIVTKIANLNYKSPIGDEIRSNLENIIENTGIIPILKNIIGSFGYGLSNSAEKIKRWKSVEDKILLPQLKEISEKVEKLFDKIEKTSWKVEKTGNVEHQISKILIDSINDPQIFINLKSTLSWFEIALVNQKNIFEVLNKFIDNVSEFNALATYYTKIDIEFFIEKFLGNLEKYQSIQNLIEQNPEQNWEKLFPFLCALDSKDLLSNASFLQDLNQVIDYFISSDSKVNRRFSRLFIFLSQDQISSDSKIKVFKNLKTLIEKYPDSVSEFVQELFSENTELSSKMDLIFYIDDLDNASSTKRSYLELLLCDDLNFLPIKSEKIYQSESILSANVENAYSLGQISFILRDKDEKQVEAFVESIKTKKIDLEALISDEKVQKVSSMLDQSILESASNQITVFVQALREIFQNFVDASKNSPDKTFSYEAYKTHQGALIHEFKDFGKGMNLKQIINLFVPYSGAKENSIGEFGWGGSTAIELAGPNSRISIISKERDKPAYRVSFSVGAKGEPVKLLEISKIEDIDDLFPTSHGTLMSIKQNLIHSLPELYFAKIDSALKYYALGTVSANRDVHLKIQNKEAFNLEDLNQEIELPQEAKKTKIYNKKMTLQVSKTKGSEILITVKNIPICKLNIYDFPEALVTELTKLGGLEINFGTGEEDTKGLVSLDRNQLLYESEMKHIVLNECFRLMAKRYIEEGVTPFGLGNSWIADDTSFDTRLSHQFLIQKKSDFSNFTYQDFLSIVTNLDFEHSGNVKCLEDYRNELRQETLNQSTPTTTQTLKQSSLGKLTLIKDKEKRVGQMMGFEELFQHCGYEVLNLPDNIDAFLEMDKIFRKIVKALQLKHGLSLRFFQAKQEKFENALPAGLLAHGNTVFINLNHFVKLFKTNRELFLYQYVDTILHEISHYYQDNSDPDTHGKTFTKLMELVTSFGIINI